MAITVHIMPRGSDGWLLKVEGKNLQDGRFATRDEALRAAQTLCDTLRADLLVHNPGGSTSRH